MLSNSTKNDITSTVKYSNLKYKVQCINSKKGKHADIGQHFAKILEFKT